MQDKKYLLLSYPGYHAKFRRWIRRDGLCRGGQRRLGQRLINTPIPPKKGNWGVYSI